MKKFSGSLLATFCLVCFNILPALSQPSSIPAGTKVTITDISDQDSYFREKGRFIGRTGVVEDDPLESSSVGKGWYSGAIKLDGASGSNYFYAIAVDIGEVTTPSQTIPDKITTSVIEAGKSVVILDISPEDAYFDEKASLVGKTGKVLKELKTSSEGKGWYGGEVVMDETQGTKYFYAVAVGAGNTQISIATTPKTNTDRATIATIPPGTHITIVDISMEDSYYSDKDMLIGKTGKVSEGLNTSGEGKGWYSGEVMMDGNLGSKYFYAAAVSLEGSSKILTLTDPGERETAELIPAGSTVIILDVSEEDAYYDDREMYIGKTGTVVEDLTLSGEGNTWYSGEISIEGEEDTIYVYAFALKVIRK